MHLAFEWRSRNSKITITMNNTRQMEKRRWSAQTQTIFHNQTTSLNPLQFFPNTSLPFLYLIPQILFLNLCIQLCSHSCPTPLELDYCQSLVLLRWNIPRETQEKILLRWKIFVALCLMTKLILTLSLNDSHDDA